MYFFIDLVLFFFFILKLLILYSSCRRTFKIEQTTYSGMLVCLLGSTFGTCSENVLPSGLVLAAHCVWESDALSSHGELQQLLGYGEGRCHVKTGRCCRRHCFVLLWNKKFAGVNEAVFF